MAAWSVPGPLEWWLLLGNDFEGSSLAQECSSLVHWKIPYIVTLKLHLAAWVVNLVVLL